MDSTVISTALRSRATREAIKTALALVLTYWIALQANWDKPMWAGLAVALVSLDSLGLSLNKGMMRMLGTLVAAMVALLLVGFFAQDRWLFMIALSLWVGGCTYMVLGSQRAYFWQVCGFVSVIICVGAATSQGGAFETAVLRAQQTGLGVLVYSLVAMLLWPSHSGDRFLDALADLHQKQRALYQAVITAGHGSVDIQQATKQLGELAAAHRTLASLLDAAIADSYDIWEARSDWQRYVDRCKALTECLEQLALFAPSDALQQLGRLIPSLYTFDAAIQQRFLWLTAPAEGLVDKSQKAAHALDVEKSRLTSLSLYDAGNLSVVRRQLRNLDTMTRELVSLRARIEGGAVEAPAAGQVSEPLVAGDTRTEPRRDTAHVSHVSRALDRDRLIATLRVMLTLWAAYLIYIYVEAVPGGPALVTLTGSLAMALAVVPQVSPLRLVIPVLLVTSLVAAIYLLVMPRLYTFWQLGLLLFCLSLLICRLFAAPAMQAVKATAFSIFISISNIQSTQSYSFIAVADIAMAFIIVLGLLSFASYIPASPRPEQVFRRLLKRFFLCAGRVFLTGGGEQEMGDARNARQSWRSSSLIATLATLPGKISNSAARVPVRLLPNASRDALDSLVARVGALAFYSQTLAQHRPDNWKEPAALRQWRESVAGALFAMADGLDGKGNESIDYRVLAARLQQLLTEIESEVRSHVTQLETADANEVEQWLCRAGLFRGIGQSLVDMCRTVDEFNWRKWDDQRFF